LSVVPKCVIEGCTRRPHTRGLCHRHYEEERQRAKDAGEPEPQARGGRRRQKPDGRGQNPNSRNNLKMWKPGQCPNPSGRSAAYVEIIQAARQMCPATLERLNEIVHDTNSKDRDRIDAAALILDRGLGRAPAAVFHGGPNQVGNMPTAVELLADDAIATPLTRLAVSSRDADYEHSLRAELRRIDQERERARADREAELAEARAARANGEEIDGPLRMLLEVKDSN
jgi:hypothetical protein